MIEPRLIHEVEKTMELVIYMKDVLHLMPIPEFDLNGEDGHPSNKLVSYATGWAQGMGFVPIVKPEEQIAVKAANHYCN